MYELNRERWRTSKLKTGRESYKIYEAQQPSVIDPDGMFRFANAVKAADVLDMKLSGEAAIR
ncbi:MAG: hypothetical protein HGB06_04145 [Chlorobaculum sp.]|nr:hypothetical protein [Chlorobaculum sp.]